MAHYTTTIIGDEKKYPNLLSNGNLVESKKLPGGKLKVTWSDPFKKPCYLFALVGGNFDCLEDQEKTPSGRTVKLQIYVEKGNLGKARHAMQALKKSMAWDWENYGREYDLDLYMIVAISDFTAGAMENKGLNIFNAKYILVQPDQATDEDYISVESVIAHEYCHNWTGNRITCRDWFQLSLKEGLTIFRESQFTEDTTLKTVARIREVSRLRGGQFAEDASPLAHPVRPESYTEINNFFTSTIYNKGAEVLRMVRTILGPKAFRKGMDLYFDRYDGQAVILEDLIKMMEEVSGIDLTQFFFWYTQAGTPEVSVKENYDASSHTYQLTFTQKCPPTPGQPTKKPMHIPISMGLLDPSGKELYQGVLNLHKEVDTFTFKDIKQKPIPSLLRGFSAPIKLKFDYTPSQLLFLLKHDTDEFDQWESSQRYIIQAILQMVEQRKNRQAYSISPEYLSALEHVFKTRQASPALISELFTLPSSKYLADQMSTVDVEGIFEVREYVRMKIVEKLKPLFLKYYREKGKYTGEYQFKMERVGERRLKNTALGYLMLLDDPEIRRLALEQFNHSLTQDMTDSLAVLTCFANADVPERDIVLKAFYEQWKNNLLVLDKWFSVQASSKLPDTLARVKALLNHPAFDKKNPNKVYALIGGFCQVNFIQFHQISGEGYRFSADQVIQMDRINPRVAANLAIPFASWKRYDSTRQKMMQSELERILKTDKLSANVFEIVQKALQ